MVYGLRFMVYGITTKQPQALNLLPKTETKVQIIVDIRK